MPITRYEYQPTLQIDGSESGPLRMFDQNNVAYTTTLQFAPAVVGLEKQAVIDRCVEAMDLQLAQDEFELIAGVR